MSLKLSFFTVVLALLFLGDPSTSTCGGCNTYTSRVGILTDTTLSLNSIWKINIKEELFRSSSDCDDEFDNSIQYFSPKVSYEMEKKILTLEQRGDTLFINAIKAGETTLFLSTSESRSVDPDIINQHLTISVN